MFSLTRRLEGAVAPIAALPWVRLLSYRKISSKIGALKLEHRNMSVGWAQCTSVTDGRTDYICTDDCSLSDLTVQHHVLIKRLSTWEYWWEYILWPTHRGHFLIFYADICITADSVKTNNIVCFTSERWRRIISSQQLLFLGQLSACHQLSDTVRSGTDAENRCMYRLL